MEGQNCTIFFNPPARMFAAVLKINTIFMQTKGLIFIFCLLASTISLANTPLNPLNQHTSPTQTEFACNIPAPTNFHVEQLGTTSVKLAWNYQADASGGYRIRTYRVSDNLLVNTTYKSQDQPLATINGLESGVEYVSYINCRCENGGDSGQNEILQYNTLIIDLIVQGYQAPSSSFSECPIVTEGGSCTFPGGDVVTHFKVTLHPSGIERRFGVQQYVVNGRTKIKVNTREGNAGQTIIISCDTEGNSPVAPSTLCSTNRVYVRTAELGVIAIVEIGFDAQVSPTLTLSCSAIAGEFCTITKEIPGSGYQINPGPGFEGIRAGTNSAETSHPATTSPNPFTETLQVSLANQTAENVRMQLFNLNGQLVLDQPFAEGAGQYELATSHLSPGFYFLRIEADGEVQTLKVIKSE